MENWRKFSKLNELTMDRLLDAKYEVFVKYLGANINDPKVLAMIDAGLDREDAPGDGDPDDDNDIRTNWSAVSSDDNSIVDGNLVRVKVGTRTMSVGDGPRTDYPNAQMVFRNGQAYFVTDNNVPITNNVSYSRNDAIAFFRNAYGISYTQAEEFVDAKIEQSILI